MKSTKGNDNASPLKPYDYGTPASSENNPTRELPGSAEIANDHATAELKRAGYGYSPSKGGQNHPMGGHNIDEKNQYTVKLKRGSSL